MTWPASFNIVRIFALTPTPITSMYGALTYPCPESRTITSVILPSIITGVTMAVLNVLVPMNLNSASVSLTTSYNPRSIRGSISY